MCVPVTVQQRSLQREKLKEDRNIFLRHGKYLEHQESTQGFPGGAVVESLPANAGDTGSSPGLGGSHMPRSY